MYSTQLGLTHVPQMVLSQFWQEADMLSHVQLHRMGYALHAHVVQLINTALCSCSSVSHSCPSVLQVCWCKQIKLATHDAQAQTSFQTEVKMLCPNH